MISSASPDAIAEGPGADGDAAALAILTGVGAPGHAFAWCAAMRRLLARQRPFAVVDDGPQDGEHPADHQARRCWVRAHAAGLQAYCVGFIAVERDVARRSRTRLALGALVDPAGLRSLVVSSETLARQLAGVLLMGARPATPAPGVATPDGAVAPASGAGTCRVVAHRALTAR